MRRLTGVPEFASSVLAEAIRRQPLSPGKVTLAWQMAAGPQLARACSVEVENAGGSSASLLIRARDPRWAAEIDRVRPVLAERLSSLLGIQTLTLRVA